MKNLEPKKLGKKCRGYKTDYYDIYYDAEEATEKCIRCKELCPDEFKECDEAFRKRRVPKKTEKPLEIKRRKKKPKRESPKSYETCGGPLEENCEKCPKFPKCLFKIKDDGKQSIEWHCKIPHFIIDKYMPKCTGVEWKVFCYLNKMADFDPKSNNFGQCYPAYRTKDVGVSKAALEQYVIKGLEELGLIEHTAVRRGNNVTTNNFTITWFKRLKGLRKKLSHNL